CVAETGGPDHSVSHGVGFLKSCGVCGTFSGYMLLSISLNSPASSSCSCRVALKVDMNPSDPPDPRKSVTATAEVCCSFEMTPPISACCACAIPNPNTRNNAFIANYLSAVGPHNAFSSFPPLF